MEMEGSFPCPGQHEAQWSSSVAQLHEITQVREQASFLCTQYPHCRSSTQTDFYDAFKAVVKHHLMLWLVQKIGV